MTWLSAFWALICDSLVYHIILLNNALHCRRQGVRQGEWRNVHGLIFSVAPMDSNSDGKKSIEKNAKWHPIISTLPTMVLPVRPISNARYMLLSFAWPRLIGRSGPTFSFVLRDINNDERIDRREYEITIDFLDIDQAGFSSKSDLNCASHVAFNSPDTDCDGRLTRPEFMAGFAMLDNDNEGSLHIHCWIYQQREATFFILMMLHDNNNTLE